MRIPVLKSNYQARSPGFWHLCTTNTCIYTLQFILGQLQVCSPLQSSTVSSYYWNQPCRKQLLGLHSQYPIMMKQLPRWGGLGTSNLLAVPTTLHATGSPGDSGSSSGFLVTLVSALTGNTQPSTNSSCDVTNSILLQLWKLESSLIQGAKGHMPLHESKKRPEQGSHTWSQWSKCLSQSESVTSNWLLFPTCVLLTHQLLHVGIYLVSS